MPLPTRQDAKDSQSTKALLDIMQEKVCAFAAAYRWQIDAQQVEIYEVKSSMQGGRLDS